jgi:hypothetical protein
MAAEKRAHRDATIPQSRLPASHAVEWQPFLLGSILRWGLVIESPHIRIAACFRKTQISGTNGLSVRSASPFRFHFRHYSSGNRLFPQKKDTTGDFDAQTCGSELLSTDGAPM